jgi:N-acetylglucosaminyldiphosphoundecaprenol N-acetyl-beta-D-mannosaminyltransferase
MRHPDPHFGYPSVSWRTSEPRATPVATSTMGPRFLRQGAQVLDTHVDAIDLDTAAHRILTWGQRHQSRLVALCDTRTAVQAPHDPSLHHHLVKADLVLAADASVAWALRREGHRRQKAIAGEHLVWRHLALAEQAAQSVHFHVDAPEALAALLSRVQADFPCLHVTGTARTASPPTPAEDLALVHQIASTGAPVVFLALPPGDQARWMHEHRGQVRAVMVGLGPEFAQASTPTTQPRAWSEAFSWLTTRACFYRRVLGNLLLGAPSSASDDARP